MPMHRWHPSNRRQALRVGLENLHAKYESSRMQPDRVALRAFQACLPIGVKRHPAEDQGSTPQRQFTFRGLAVNIDR